MPSDGGWQREVRVRSEKVYLKLYLKLLRLLLLQACASTTSRAADAGPPVLHSGSHFLCHLPFSVHFTLPNSDLIRFAVRVSLAFVGRRWNGTDSIFYSTYLSLCWFLLFRIKERPSIALQRTSPHSASLRDGVWGRTLRQPARRRISLFNMPRSIWITCPWAMWSYFL